MRRGASILEVLFAILVVSVGLLGVVSIFPVAASQQRKARIADATAISGRSSVDTFKARGMSAPSNWIGWNPFATPPQFTAIPLWPSGLPMQSWNSFCIDPRFIASHSTATEAGQAMYFPCYVPAGNEPRMYRITIGNGLGAALSQLQADSIFQFDDDLLYNRKTPTDSTGPIPYDLSANDRPAAQAFYRLDHDSDASTASLPLKRNSGGEMSWFATLVPKVDMATIPQAPLPRTPLPPPYPPHQWLEPPPAPPIPPEYLLSIVVCSQRPADFPLDYVGERVLGVDFAELGGTGYAGGECLLTWTAAQTPANDANANELLKVRAGNWIMLSGNLTHGSGAMIPTFRWYRVTDASNEWEYHTAEGHYAVAVSLSGSDWDTTLANQEAVIVSGVTGVYEKTIMLER